MGLSGIWKERWRRRKENGLPFMLSLFEGQPNGRGQDAIREGWEFQRKDGKRILESMLSLSHRITWRLPDKWEKQTGLS